MQNIEEFELIKKTSNSPQVIYKGNGLVLKYCNNAHTNGQDHMLRQITALCKLKLFKKFAKDKGFNVPFDVVQFKFRSVSSDTEIRQNEEEKAQEEKFYDVAIDSSAKHISHLLIMEDLSRDIENKNREITADAAIKTLIVLDLLRIKDVLFMSGNAGSFNIANAEYESKLYSNCCISKDRILLIFDPLSYDNGISEELSDHFCRDCKETLELLELDSDYSKDEFSQFIETNDEFSQFIETTKKIIASAKFKPMIEFINCYFNHIMSERYTIGSDIIDALTTDTETKTIDAKKKATYSEYKKTIMEEPYKLKQKIEDVRNKVAINNTTRSFVKLVSSASNSMISDRDGPRVFGLEMEGREKEASDCCCRCVIF